MKKNIFRSLLLAAAFCVPFAGMAQTASDMFKFSQNNYEGTARTSAMGNAFTSLGGDLGSLAINPAGTAMFGFSEFSMTFGLNNAYSNTNYTTNSTSASKTRFTMPNLAVVLNFNTGRNYGIVNYTVGMGINRVADFHSVMSASGRQGQSSWLGEKAATLGGVDKSSLEFDGNYNPYYSANASWAQVLAWNTYLLADLDNNEYIASTENIDDETGVISVGGVLGQEFNKRTTGGITEFALNFAGNVEDRLYFGANLNLYSLSYSHNESFSEYALDSKNFQDGFVSMDHTYRQSTDGTGVSLKAGVIWNPFGGLRLGATICTPTWYSMSDNWQETMRSEFNNGKSYYEETPIGNYDYQMKTAMRYSLGASYVFGRVALISADYEHANYSNGRFSDINGSTAGYSDVNGDIANAAVVSDMLRLGGELRLGAVSLRAGYNKNRISSNGYHLPTTSSCSFGVGFKVGEAADLDIAYIRSNTTSDRFQLYGNYLEDADSPVGEVFGRNSKILATLALKF